ncbi:unnamed protein product, partial [Ectocarpus sp. 12 AP-2014]
RVGRRKRRHGHAATIPQDLFQEDRERVLAPFGPIFLLDPCVDQHRGFSSQAG